MGLIRGVILYLFGGILNIEGGFGVRVVGWFFVYWGFYRYLFWCYRVLLGFFFLGDILVWSKSIG